jgi:hypothetical protein
MPSDDIPLKMLVLLLELLKSGELPRNGRPRRRRRRPPAARAAWFRPRGNAG